jgi:hypothetical protein
MENITGFFFTIAVGAFVLILKWINVRRYQIKLDFIHKERLAAMEKGIPTPEVADYENGRPRRESLLSYMRVNPRWPLGAGILLVLGGAGTLIAMKYSGDPYHQQVWTFALIPIFLGVGLWLHYLVMRPRNDR